MGWWKCFWKWTQVMILQSYELKTIEFYILSTFYNVWIIAQQKQIMYSRTAVLRLCLLNCFILSRLLKTPVRFYLYALELIISLLEIKTKNLKKYWIRNLFCNRRIWLPISINYIFMSNNYIFQNKKLLFYIFCKPLSVFNLIESSWCLRSASLWICVTCIFVLKCKRRSSLM